MASFVAGKATGSALAGLIGKMRVRRLIYKQLHQSAWEDGGLSIANSVILGVICISVFLVIIETEKPFYHQYKNVFSIVDYSIGCLFALEYAMRVWSAGERKKFRGWKGRIKYMMTPTAIIDLLIVVPFFISSNSNIFIARAIRLFRILALAKLTRYSRAFALVREALWSRRHELTLSMVLTCMVLLVASTIMWVVEPDEEFRSIPRALWWGIITLTTVGYGDVYPQTVAGKICSGITALAGIGLIAMPAGILAAAFSEAINKHKDVLEQSKTGQHHRLKALRRKDHHTEELEFTPPNDRVAKSMSSKENRGAGNLNAPALNERIKMDKHESAPEPKAAPVNGVEWVCEHCGHDKFVPRVPADHEAWTSTPKL